AGGARSFEDVKCLADPGGKIAFTGGTSSCSGMVEFRGQTIVAGTATLMATDPQRGVSFEGTLSFQSGSLSGPGYMRISNQGLLNWTGGTIEGGGVIDNQGEARISGDGEKKINGRLLRNFGKAVWTGSGPVSCTGTNGFVAIENHEGAIFDMQN